MAWRDGRSLKVLVSGLGARVLAAAYCFADDAPLVGNGDAYPPSRAALTAMDADAGSDVMTGTART